MLRYVGRCKVFANNAASFCTCIPLLVAARTFRAASGGGADRMHALGSPVTFPILLLPLPIPAKFPLPPQK